MPRIHVHAGGRYLHAEQAACLLGVSRRTIERMVSAGELERGHGWAATVTTASVRATLLAWQRAS